MHFPQVVVGGFAWQQVSGSDGTTEVTTLHALYDGVGAITRWYHDKSNDTVVVGFQFGRDKVGNPQYELREHQSIYGDEYTYDALHRLTRTIYDDATPATPTGSPDFLYDLIGNRTTAYQKSADATTYLHNPVNEYISERACRVDNGCSFRLAGDGDVFLDAPLPLAAAAGQVDAGHLSGLSCTQDGP